LAVAATIRLEDWLRRETRFKTTVERAVTMLIDVFLDAMAVNDDSMAVEAVDQVANLNGVSVRARARREADNPNHQRKQKCQNKIPSHVSSLTPPSPEQVGALDDRVLPE
jgi:hypothetical protein